MAYDPEDDAILDGEGAPATARFEHAIKKHILGRTVTGVRYCSSEEIEPGNPVCTVRLDLDDGGIFTVVISPDADVSIWLNRDDEPAISHLVH